MKRNITRSVLSFVGAVIVSLVLSAGALAGSQVLTFDSNNWGAEPWGTYSTIMKFESSGGNPGACLRLNGISGVGGAFSNAGFTGDFAAGGYGKIAFDIKVDHWYPNPTQPAPVAYVFVRKGNPNDPWCKQIQGFAPVTTQWKRYSVDFDPNWSDTEAHAHGWSIIHFAGATEAGSFKETLHNVFQTGLWVKVIDGGAECHIFFDNYSLLPGSGSGSGTFSPIRKIQKSRIKALPKTLYPVKTKN